MEQHVSLNNHSGFTLIEFCVAVLIMMVGLLGLLQAVNMATVYNLGSLLRNEAITLADDRMVRAKTSVFDAATFTALASDNPGVTNLVSRGVRAGFANYSVVLNVTAVGSNSKELTSRVAWRYKGKKLTHTISSVVMNPNP
jgi:type IV pilus assembly protein PilV